MSVTVNTPRIMPTGQLHQSPGTSRPHRVTIAVQSTVQKSVTKRPRSGVDDGVIADWLGGSDLTDTAEGGTASSASTGRGRQLGNAATFPVTDDEMLDRLANRLAERNIASFARIGLDVKRGVVTVRGNVSSKGERLLLNHILRTTAGVLKVNDGLSFTQPVTRRLNFHGMIASISATVYDSIPRWKSIPIASIVSGLTLLLVIGLCWRWSASQPVAVFPLKGRLMMDGTALSQASVVFHPVGASKLPNRIQPRGVAKTDGTFDVETFKPADGVPEGEFIATVHLFKTVIVDGDPVQGQSLLPDMYSRPETSPFRIKVSRETKEIASLELHQPLKR